MRRAQEEVSCARVSDEMMPSCRPLYASLLCHTASLLPLPLRKPPPTPCRVCACRTTATTAGTTEAANRPPTLPLPPKAQLAYQLGPASNSSAPQGAGFSCPWDAAKQLRPGCGELLVPCSHSLGDDAHVRTRCAIHGRKNSGAEQLWRADSPALSVAAKLPPPPAPTGSPRGEWPPCRISGAPVGAAAEFIYNRSGRSEQGGSSPCPCSHSAAICLPLPCLSPIIALQKLSVACLMGGSWVARPTRPNRGLRILMLFHLLCDELHCPPSQHSATTGVRPDRARAVVLGVPGTFVSLPLPPKGIWRSSVAGAAFYGHPPSHAHRGTSEWPRPASASTQVPCLVGSRQ